MMTIVDGLLLFGAMLVLALLPSASVALVVARSITHGVRQGIAVGVGIVVGDITFLLLAMLGLAFIAEVLGVWFLLLRLLGAAYLIFLGLSLFRSGRAVPSPALQAGGEGGLIMSLVAGFALTLGDAKAIVFYLSLLPMFIDPATAGTADVVSIIAITVAAVGGAKVFYACSAWRLALSLGSGKAAAVLPKAAGVALVGAGAYVAMKS